MDNEEKLMICPICGAVVSNNTKKCPYCCSMLKKRMNIGTKLIIIFICSFFATYLLVWGIVEFLVVDDTPSIKDTNTFTSETKINDNISMGKKMALDEAKNYLKAMGFSKQGLKQQLEYEGYTIDEATYAVNNCGANWKEQAVRVAKNYLKTMPFSKQGLIEQLEYEGFTNEEAAYGVDIAYN